MGSLPFPMQLHNAKMQNANANGKNAKIPMLDPPLYIGVAFKPMLELLNLYRFKSPLALVTCF